VTFGMVVVSGNVVVTFGIVVVIGSVVVGFGSVDVTGSVVEIGGSAVVIVTCGTAERPGTAMLVRKPSRRTTASAAARLTTRVLPESRHHNPQGTRNLDQLRIARRVRRRIDASVVGMAARDPN
jgi:hypothetical protein